MAERHAPFSAIPWPLLSFSASFMGRQFAALTQSEQRDCSSCFGRQFCTATFSCTDVPGAVCSNHNLRVVFSCHPTLFRSYIVVVWVVLLNCVVAIVNYGYEAAKNREDFLVRRSGLWRRLFGTGLLVVAA